MPDLISPPEDDPSAPSHPHPDTKVMEDEKGLKSSQRSGIICKNSILVIFLSFLVLSLADIFYYAYQSKKFNVDSAVLNLDSTSSDAQLILDAELPLTSYLHSYSVQEGHCRLFYTEKRNLDSKLVGNIFVSVNKPSLTSDPGHAVPVKVVFDLKNTDFTQLRQLLWDVHFGGSDGAKFNIDCSASITITLYRLIPLNSKQLSFALSHFSEEVELSQPSPAPESQPEPQPQLEDDEIADPFPIGPIPIESETSKTSSLFEIRRSAASVIQTLSDISSNANAEVLSTSSSRVDIGFNQQLPTVDSPSSSVNIKSFSVLVPRLAYSLETVDEDTSTTLLISNSPTEVELFDTTQPELNTIVTLDCISSLPGDENLNCSLWNGLNLEKVFDGLGSGRLSFRADSTPDYANGERGNFLTNFFGPLHSLEVQPITSAEARRLKVSSTMSSSDLITPRDPDLTDDSGCYLVTADSASESLICSEVEKGFSMMYLSILDGGSEALATIKSVTSWAPFDEFAFTTDFVADFRGEYLFVANVSASKDFKNSSLLLNYFEGSHCFFHGNAFTSWSFPQHGSQGDFFYSIQFFEEFGIFGTLATEGFLTYGDNHYHVKLAQEIALNQMKYNLTAEGVGRYGGTWLQWFGTLDSSQLVIDGNLKSQVSGLISSSLSTSGTYGDLVLNVNAQSGSDDNQLTTSNHAMWDTTSVWDKEGTLKFNSSLLYLKGTEVNWDAMSVLDYQDNGYMFSVANSNPSALENFYCHGNGGYGGNFMHWSNYLPFLSPPDHVL
jgi:hypothetical protein